MKLFLNIAECINDFNIENFQAYLFGIARNIFFGYIRKKKPTVSMENEEIYEDKVQPDNFEENDFNRTNI